MWDQRSRIEAYVWVVLILPTLLFWKDSILWVSLMSIYAIVKTCFSEHEARMAKREANT